MGLNQSDGLSRSAWHMPQMVNLFMFAHVSALTGIPRHTRHHSELRFADTAIMTWHTVLQHQAVAVPPYCYRSCYPVTERRPRQCYSKIPTPDRLSGADPGTRYPRQPNKVDLHSTAGSHVAFSAGNASMSGPNNIPTNSPSSHLRTFHTVE